MKHMIQFIQLYTVRATKLIRAVYLWDETKEDYEIEIFSGMQLYFVCNESLYVSYTEIIN